ncbi:MAG: hypothetical protein KAH13_00500 [Tenericutes bacterium]|nr:hypothetical protein [Mycoplasmatota bacterium]
MEMILKQIKKDLYEISKKEAYNVKHSKNKFQDKLEYFNYFTLNRKKHFLVFRFVYQKLEESLSFTYHIEIHNRNQDLIEDYNLSDIDSSLPGINEEYKDMIKSIYDYQVDNQRIVNKVDIKQQYEKIMLIFKKNYMNITKYAETIAK